MFRFPRRQKSPFTMDGVLKEEHEQAAVVAWLRLKYPSALFTISPNGMKLPKSVAIRLARMGYRAGTPDLIIDEPRGIYHGLRVEMKASKGGRVSDEQNTFLSALRQRGYAAYVCEGAAIAKQIIELYLDTGLEVKK